MKRIAAMVVLVALAAGCQGMGFKGESALEDGEAAVSWPFAPVAMRVHPFTAIGVEGAGGATVLEVRMELLDQLGDVTKGVGEFRFELYGESAQASRRGSDEQINVWDAPLRTLEQNARHYDAVTRTYAFKLHVNPPPPADRRLRLVVWFVDPAGRRITAEAPLSYRPHRPAEAGGEKP